MSTIAIIADIHGNLPALEAVIADLRGRAATTVVNLGDHASGPLWPGATLDLLMAQDWLHIAGNHDRQLVHQPPDQHGESDRYAAAELSAAHRDWLAALPATARLGADMLLCHGTPADDSSYLLESVAHGGIRLASPAEIRQRLGAVSAQVVLCGHTHHPRLVQLDATTIINPGSVGLPAYADSTPEPHVMETGSPAARYALLDRSADGWQATFITVAYDHLAAAAQAERNGRSDWANALRSGRMAELG
jgi:putative phosphoesterase